MRSLITVLTPMVLTLSLLASPVEPAEKLRVVATIPDLKSLAEAVGGDRVEVDTLARGTQNTHEAEVRPTMMLKIRRADALIVNGLELDNWVATVIRGANNPEIIHGAPGFIDTSRGIPVLEVPSSRVDRSMGDVHPFGNPHYTLDPGLTPIITQNIVDGLARLAPEHRAVFEQNRRAFLGRLDQALGAWTKTMEPFKGEKVVVYHPLWIYFLTRFGLVQATALEDRPGIPASPRHVARVIQQMRNERIKVILVEPWNDQKLAARVAAEAGARSVVMASSVGAIKDTDTYIAAMEFNVNTLAQALR